MHNIPLPYEIEHERKRPHAWRVRLFVIGYALGALSMTVLAYWGRS